MTDNERIAFVTGSTMVGGALGAVYSTKAKDDNMDQDILIGASLGCGSSMIVAAINPDKECLCKMVESITKSKAVKCLEVVSNNISTCIEG